MATSRGVRIILATSVIALLGCGALERYRDQQSQAAASAAASALAGPSAGSASAGGTPARATEFRLAKLEVGQFVEYRQSGGAGSRYGWAVLSEEASAFWLQLISDVGGDRRLYVMHMLLDIDKGTEINGAKPKELELKMPNGKVQRISGAMMQMASQGTTGSLMIDMDESEISRGPRKDLTVGAGTFPGTFEWSGTTEWKGRPQKTTFWSHASVPITGVVRATDGTRTWELAKSGLTGAKSEL